MNLSTVVCLVKGHEFEHPPDSIHTRTKNTNRVEAVNRECERCGLEIGRQL